MSPISTAQKPRARAFQKGDRTYLKFDRCPPREVRDALRHAGYQFVPQRGAWRSPSSRGEG